MTELQPMRLNAFEVFLHVRDRMRRQVPTSMIRLGDGEGAVLGYPTITNRKDVNFLLLRWLRTTAIEETDVLHLVDDLKCAVRDADILGLPRKKQIDSFHLWKAVQESVEKFGLIGKTALLTHTAIHRLLSHALLYRPILENAQFLGIISCRPVAELLQREFNIANVRWHGVRGALNDPGDVETIHYPTGYRQLRETLEVPFRGALFLVGAGVFGKVYCQWIKERGGIALDIGSIFDSWAKVGRIGHPVRSLDVYREIERIERSDAVVRYNDLLDHFDLDIPRIPPPPERHLSPSPIAEASYLQSLPESW